jgi:ABC-type lipoprotein release transport system permease subunit
VPVEFETMEAMFDCVALVATLIPAIRAATIAPVMALHQEQ